MRGIHVPFLGLALIGLLLGGTANAQKATKPAAVKVIVGADGSIKVIDVKTGKEIAAEIVRTARKDGAQEAEERLRREALERQRREADEAALKALRQEQERLERARQEALRREQQRQLEAQQKALQDALQREFNKLKDKKIVVAQPKAKTPAAGKAMILKIVIGPDGKAQIVADEPAAAPRTVEGKLDLILKQLGDLRRDVDIIQKKLTGPTTPYYFPYSWRGTPGQGGQSGPSVPKKVEK
ncbi:MAG: hypothetical protein HYX68_12535 [Planctomycetes bacterium]|nr:hypothetical protein [Planctomycetota bacterium]